MSNSSSIEHPYPRERTWSDCEAEIERLRKELAVEKGWVSQYRDSYCKQVTEIERLRKDFTDLLRLAANDASKYQAEIERLRTELDLVGRGAAAQIQERTDQFNSALAEIERLRGLLRHVINNPWDYDAQRVREALGE